MVSFPLFFIIVKYMQIVSVSLGWKLESLIRKAAHLADVG